MTYIGRDKEISLLRNLANSSEAEIAAIYGRRRVGKSSLVKEAYKENLIYSIEGLENASESEQIDNFYLQLEDHFPNTKNLEKEKNWYAALSLLYEQTKNQECVILLDELQWLANYRDQFISILKQIWDQKFIKNQKLTMVLCGSVASFMVNKVIKSKALYGRVAVNIHLSPFKLRETRLFFENRSVEEAIQAYILIGGIPGYLNKLQLYDSVILGIQALAFEKHGYFISEFEKIFVSQFGKSENYEIIIRYLAKYSHGLTRKQLSLFPDISNGGTLSTCLNDLEVAGLISSFHSFNAEPSGKKRVYLLTDPYCRFYLSFIEQNITRINQDIPNIFINITKTPAFSSWMGLGAEILCHNHTHELAKLMGFSDIIYQAGPYLNTKAKRDLEALQIDLVYNRKDSVLTVCEVKYTNDIGLEIIDEMKSKINKLEKFKNKTIQAALIYKNKPSKEVFSSAFFNHLVCINDIATITL